MATKSRKQKPASRAAVKSVAKKTTSRKPAAEAAKPVATKPAARRVPQSIKAATPAPKRRKQRVAISHLREEDFKADGLRAYAQYRDLGIVEATGGLARAHVIRLLPPCNPQEVSKLHTHDVEFQMVYVLKGWVKSYLEGIGETLMKQGSAWTQPPRIRHMILDYSDDVELLEVILPADFKTVELST
jgi:hypothetical protein